MILCCLRPTAGYSRWLIRLPLGAVAPAVNVDVERALSESTDPGARVSVVQPSDELPGEPVADEARGGPTVLRIMLGTQLRRLREASGTSPDQAGYEIRGSRSKISRIEHGRVGFKERDVEDLLTLYGVTDPDLPPMTSRRATLPFWLGAVSAHQ